MTCVNETKLLRQLKRGSTAALSEIIELYTPYVYAIASNVMRPMLPAEDVEEAVSDCFAALWYNRDAVEPGKLKGYLAVVVRSKALSALRSKHLESALEDDFIDISADSPEEGVLTLELRELAHEAVDTLGEPDCEIFKRHYFLYQKTEDIAAALGMNGATVRTKLARGRQRLKYYLEERGYGNEA